MSNFIIPMTLLRRGYRVVQQGAMKQAFPGTGTNTARRDFTQYQQGKILLWNLGYTSITVDTTVFGSSQTGE